VHEILCVHSRIYFTCFTWRSSVAVIGAPLRGVSSVSSRPFLMEFTHRRTVSYEGACVPKPSFNDF
jgi:hypothetical protein